MKAMTFSIRLALALLLCGGAALAQDLTLDTRTNPQAMNTSTAAMPFELELGWRFTSVDGNEDMYRSQINEREGFLIRAFTLQTSGESRGLFDHLRIDASELGAGPAGMLRLEAGRSGAYTFRMNYRQAEMYSALPRLANPFLAAGVIPGQHTLDLDRQTFDADFELLGWRHISPFIGFTRYDSSGPGTTTYTVGGDDFLLASDQEESETEFRAGFGFNWRSFYGQLTQGWRSIETEESMTLFAGTGAGNNPGNVLGRPVTATGLTRNGETSIDAPFTNVYVTGDLGDRIRLVADYITTDAETESSEEEVLTGSFVSFGLRRFFGGLDEQVDSRADNRTSRGGLRAEIVLFEGVDLLASYQMRDRDLSGTALINSIYRNTVNFSNADPRDVTELLDAENELTREDAIVMAGVRARALGPFSVWAYYTQTQQDLTMTPSVEEIVVPGPSQGGEFERSIDSVDLGGAFTRAGFTLQASFRADDADDAILRTEYRDRTRTRVRAGWGTQTGRFRIGALAEQTDLENDTEGVGYDAEIGRMVGEVELALLEPLRLWATYTDYQAETQILFRRPETFAIETSLHDEDGQAIEGGLRFGMGRFVADASFSQYQNEGTTPFDVDRFRLGAGLDITPRYGLSAEFVTDEYAETGEWLCGMPIPCAQAPGVGNFDAERIGVFFRIRQ